MFITVADIKDTTDIELDVTTVRIAQLMMESWVGRTEAEIDDAGDMAILGRATLFQAIYIGASVNIILQQAAVKSMSISGSESTVFDTEMFAPYMSPWAIQTCKKLSWVGSRSIYTGAMNDVPRYRESFAPVEDEWVSE